MKTTIVFTINWLIIILSLLQSCTKQNDEMPFMALKSESDALVKLDSEKTEFVLRFESNVDWIIEIDGDWISLGDAKYGKGSAALTVSVETNEELQKREGEISVRDLSAELPPISVKITQQGTIPYLEIDRETILLDGEKGSYSFSVSTNVPFTVKSSESWLEVSAILNNEITLSFERNEDKERSADIVVSGTEYSISDTVAVTQELFNNYTPFERDVIALKKFHESSNNQEWVNKWDINSDPLTWYGLTWINVDGYNRVYEVLMWDNNMTGPIPEEVGYLTEVTLFHMGGNNLNGTLPSGFEHLTKMHTLALQGNELEGFIPAYFALLTNLENFYIDGNKFSGEIPNEILESPMWPRWEEFGFRNQQAGYGFTN